MPATVHDNESTPLVVTTTSLTTQRIKDDTSETTTTLVTIKAVKYVAVMVVILAIVSLLSVAVGNDRGSTVSLLNYQSGPHSYSYRGDVKECPDKCQYTGDQAEWHVVSGRACCQDFGGHRGYVCFLNNAEPSPYRNHLESTVMPTNVNACDCKDVGHSEPCYIDTRCDPFQTWQDEECKARPDTQCSDYFFGGGCTHGYRCSVLAKVCVPS